MSLLASQTPAPGSGSVLLMCKHTAASDGSQQEHETVTTAIRTALALQQEESGGFFKLTFRGVWKLMENKKGKAYLISRYYLSLYWSVQRAILTSPSETWGLELQDRIEKVRETA